MMNVGDLDMVAGGGDSLGQRLANICKGPDSEYFQPWGSYSLCYNYTALPLFWKSSHK